MKNYNWYEELEAAYAEQAALDEIYGVKEESKPKRRGKRNSPSQLDRRSYFGEQDAYSDSYYDFGR